MQSTPLVHVPHILRHLEHESSGSSEHGTCATSDLDSGTSELRWRGRVGRGGGDRSATGRLDSHGGVVDASS